VLSDYEFGKDLGKGTFGVTRLVRDRTSAGPAACKSMCKTSIAGNQTQIEDIRREVAILRHLAGHDCVVNLRGVYEDTRQVHLVMDLCTGGDLHEYITTRPCGRLSEKDAAAVTKSMLEALAFCHGRGVVHRDVKPENVLLEKQGTVQTGVKVSDFGVSAWYKPGQLLTEIVGTPYYMAPEVIQRRYGPEADVWSAGVVLYLMLTGRLPFNGNSDRHVVKAVLQAEPDYSEKMWAGVSATAQAVVKAMLVKDPKQRADIASLLQQEWFMQFGLASSSNSGTSISSVAGVCNHCPKKVVFATAVTASPATTSSSSGNLGVALSQMGTSSSSSMGGRGSLSRSSSNSSICSQVAAPAQLSCSFRSSGRELPISSSCTPRSPNSSISSSGGVVSRSSSGAICTPFAAAAAGSSYGSISSSSHSSFSNRAGSNSSLFSAAPESPPAHREMSSGWFTDLPVSGRCREVGSYAASDEAAGLAALLGLGSGSYY